LMRALAFIEAHRAAAARSAALTTTQVTGVDGLLETEVLVDAHG
jgi:hypothetical protein